MIKPNCSKLDFIYKTQLYIYDGDKEAAKKATRATLKHNLILEGLWVPGKKRKDKID